MSKYCKIFNNHLRNGSQINETDLAILNNLTNGLENCKLSENTVLYRNVDYDFSDAVFGKDITNLLKEGKNKQEIISNKLFGFGFEEKAFCSTSYTKDTFKVNSPIKFEINVPINTKGGVIEEYSKQPQQKEFLLVPGKKFLINKIKWNNNNWLIDLYLTN